MRVGMKEACKCAGGRGLEAIVMAVMVVITGCSDPTSAPQPTARPGPTARSSPTAVPEPPVGKVGEATAASGVSLLVSSVSKTDKIGPSIVARIGHVIVVLDVTLESSGSDTAFYGPLYFKIRDSEGVESSMMLGAPAPALTAGKLAKGEKTRGNVAAEVRADARGLLLFYQPTSNLSDNNKIRIVLGE
jgi:hypothetical protein